MSTGSDADTDNNTTSTSMLFPKASVPEAPHRATVVQEAGTSSGKCDSMSQAIFAVRDKKLSIRAAAAKYQVHRSTLCDRVKGKQIAQRGGVQTLTAGEEQILVTWIKQMVKQHLPITKTIVLETVRKLLGKEKKQNIKRESLRNDSSVSKGWWRGFLSRHCDVVNRVPEAISSSRSSVSKKLIRQWFA